MLLEIRLSNFFSISDEVCLDFRAGNIKTAKARELTSNYLEWNGEKILKSLAIYGPNASGKTNLIKAIRLCCRIILDSHQFNDGVRFNYTPFKFNDGLSKPSKFQILFVHEGIEYDYSFSLTPQEILEEELYYYPKGRRARLFTRHKGEEGHEYIFSDSIKRPHDITINTGSNTLFLSRASQMGREEFRSVYRYFNESFILGLLPYSHTQAEKLFLQNKELVLHALKLSDSDIVDIRPIKEQVEGQNIQFDLNGTAPQVSKQMMERVRYETIHKHSTEVAFDLDSEESDGTKNMFGLLLRLIDVVQKGRSLLLDEFDSSLHSRIAEYIIDIFHASQKSQFLFTTHNTNLINLDKFRKDQIVFVNKNESGATEVYSLFDFKDFRDNMDPEKGYLQGRFDAVPFVDDSILSLKKLLEG